MKALLVTIRATLADRAVTPLVLGLFFVIYVGIAFFTDEALTTLLDLTRHSIVLSVVLLLVPLNLLARLIEETALTWRKRRLARGGEEGVLPGMYDEVVNIPRRGDLDLLRERLAAAGYTTSRTSTTLAASCGVARFPARLLLLAGGCCLFTGIVLSLTTRVTHRSTVIEGEPLPQAAGEGGLVQRITLKDSSGPILERSLAIEVSPDGAGGSTTFGLYPPGMYRGYFVYPRYLGIAPLIRFAAPDLPAGFETHFLLMIYPPGKEDSAEIPGTAYRIVFSMAPPESGGDPFQTGRIALRFKVMKGEELLEGGMVPVGGEFVHGGYRLAFPDFRRTVDTDFVRDFGVPLVWAGALFLVASLCFWLPVRLFLPRRELLFVRGAADVIACSRAEGRARHHAGIYHEALDLLAGEESCT